MKILVVDVGGTNVKVHAPGHREPIKIPSGDGLTPAKMVKAVLEAVRDCRFDVVSIGYPGVVVRSKAVTEPVNLGRGWVNFNFRKAFGRPVRMINDAAMQALGSYKGGRLLFLGLGTGLGSALVIDGVLVPMELAHLPYKKGQTYEDYVGKAGMKRSGKKKWRSHVLDVIERFRLALNVEDVVLGGGNAKLMKELPKGVRLGGNANAFLGGYRLWDDVRKSPRFAGAGSTGRGR
ncbi:MAG TPA: ROK family protein [Vicinamibacterales bacterium]|nr:ROK family protein [Vicinamibacterales bacterium]